MIFGPNLLRNTPIKQDTSKNGMKNSNLLATFSPSRTIPTSVKPPDSYWRRANFGQSP